MSNKLVPSGGGFGGILRWIDAALATTINMVSSYGSRVAGFFSWDLGAGAGEQRVGIVMCDGVPGCSATDDTAADTSLANFPLGTLAMNVNTGDWFVKVHATNSEWRTLNPMYSASAVNAHYNYLSIGSLAFYNSLMWGKTAAAGTGTWAEVGDIT